jgi:hypothetical protein
LVPAFDEDGTSPLDIVAFSMRNPGRFRTLLGITAILGLGEIFNPSSYWNGTPCRLCRTPLEWLQEGIAGAAVRARSFTFAIDPRLGARQACLQGHRARRGAGRSRRSRSEEAGYSRGAECCRMTYVPFEQHRRQRERAKSNGHDHAGVHHCSVRTGLDVIALEAFMSQQLAPREMVLDPIIATRSLCLLFAHRGIGKTMVAFNIAWAVACGRRFLRWSAPKSRRVLYVDGEMPQQLLQERIRTMIASSDVRPPAADYFRLLSLDRQELGVSINLSRREHQIEIEKIIETGVEFVIFDNISTLVNGGPENDAVSWDEMQQWLLQLRRRGVTVLLIHHSGRGENARGTSKREDVLDTVIKLIRPDDYEMDEGARFEVHLTKARGVTGDDALPFEARLTVLEGRDIWAFEILRDRVLDQIELLTRERKSVREIAEEVGLAKSKVNRLQAKLRAEGRIQ